MSFTIENARNVLELNVDVNADLPQEVMATDIKKSIAKTIGKFHPLSLSQFMKGLEDIGAISVKGMVVIMLMYPDEL